jgi:AGZA family xanthine/uracil permease-like MFS transporter
MLMVGSMRKIEFDDLTEALPAFACIALMVFTYNIANGLTAGLVLYPIGKAVAGRAREVNWGNIVLALLCLTYFVFGLPH